MRYMKGDFWLRLMREFGRTKGKSASLGEYKRKVVLWKEIRRVSSVPGIWIERSM